MAARNQRLQLDKSVVLREVLFYGLALALLWVALSNRQSKNDGTDDVYIFLGVAKSLMLLGGFVLYVLVCANFERIVGFLDVYLGTTTQTDGSYLSNLPSVRDQTRTGSDSYISEVTTNDARLETNKTTDSISSSGFERTTFQLSWTRKDCGSIRG